MNQVQSQKIMQGMIQFIQAHGKERVGEIQAQTESDFVVQKEKLIAAERKRLNDQYQKELKQAEINLKIEKSAEQNKERISRMQKINELVQSLQLSASASLNERLQNNPSEYARLLKDLLIQGLIKLIEPKVVLRCRQSDVDALEGVIDEAV